MDSCLCLTSTSVFEGRLFNGLLDGRTLNLDHTTFVAASGRDDFCKSVSDKKFDTAYSYAEAPRHHSSTLISQIASCMRPGGIVKVSEPEVCYQSSHQVVLLSASCECRMNFIVSSVMQAGALETASALRKALLLAGLTDIAVDTSKSTSAGSRVLVRMSSFRNQCARYCGTSCRVVNVIHSSPCPYTTHACI